MDFKSDLYWHKEIMDCPDHSGIGYHPADSIVEEYSNITNQTFFRGGAIQNCEAIEMKATLYFRDVLNDVIKQANVSDLKILDLGSGRGGVGRFVAKTAKKARKLSKFVAADISEANN